MALTLCVGFVVDDAIVMLENIVRHMEMGKTRLQAALDGSREIGFTIISMTLSLVAVFIPVLFMGGLMGRLLNEFAVTIAVAILASGFVSLTLTPMLCSRFLGEDTGRLLITTEAAEGTSFEGMLHYQQALADILRSNPAVDSFMSSIGTRGGTATGTNTGTIFAKLTPRSQRPHVDQLIQQLRPQ